MTFVIDNGYRQLTRDSITILSTSRDPLMQRICCNCNQPYGRHYQDEECPCKDILLGHYVSSKGKFDSKFSVISLTKKGNKLL